MALTATYKDLKNATIKISRIWGGKREKWNAWVEVFVNKTHKTCIATFSVSTDYVEDENPYIALYNKIAELAFISNVSSDDKNFIEKQEEAEIDNAKPKRKPRTKKATK